MKRTLSQILFPLEKLLHATGVPFVIPLYHTTGLSHHQPYTRHLYQNRTEKEFEHELDWLLKHFEPVELAEIAVPLRKNRNKPAFHITVDDGLAVCQEIMAPVLYKKGIPATFFINPAFVGDAEIMHRYKANLLLSHIETDKAALHILSGLLRLPLEFNSLKRFFLDLKYPSRAILDDCAERLGMTWSDLLYGHRLYMTEEQLYNIQEAGFNIGAHSWDHPEYTTLSLQEQIEQTERSIQYVREKFNPTVMSFAFPFTDSDVSVDFFKWLDTHVDVSFGCAGLKLDTAAPHFQRIPVEKFDYGMRAILLKQTGAFFIKKILGKHIVKHG